MKNNRWLLVAKLDFCRVLFLVFVMFMGSFSIASAQNVILPVPQSIVTQYNLDIRWYNKYIDAWGIPILGSRNLSDAALLKAHAQLGALLRTYPYWPLAALDLRKVRVVLFARNERASAIPEFYARYGTGLDGVYWAGFGATLSLPITAGSEANILDNWGQENLLVHEFAHTLAGLALPYINGNFSNDLQYAYTNARAKGLWSNTYAVTNIDEYWAEGVQTYFDVNRVGPVGGDGVHNDINTRVKLFAYDRLLFNLLDGIYQGHTLP
ncbi:hypothetical protein HZU77_000340 [Neisseriaceae bacterium TC5R-5]|nr:hypothetical protein [Neisseriaceae bacterium TC5R-5]